MQLDLAVSVARQIGQTGEIFGGVLLTREEKRMPGRSSVGIAKIARHLGITVGPALHALKRHLGGGFFPARLVVVAKSEQQMTVAPVAWRDHLTGGRA